MNCFDDSALELLKSYDSENWFVLFDKRFSNKALPAPLCATFEHTSEYLLELDNFIIGSEDIDLLNTYHSILIEYYFNLPLLSQCYSKLYTLHWVFANIKIRLRNNDFFHQLFQEDLNNIYYDGIHLHSSLLSLASSLPNLSKVDASAYLLSSVEHIEDLSFHRVALRYLIEKKSMDNYCKYYAKLSAKSNEANIAFILTESLVDVQDFYGSFKNLYQIIDKFWINYTENNKSNSIGIVRLLNSKYLKEGEKWYDNDDYAKLLKIFINSTIYPPSLSLLNELYNAALQKDDFQQDEMISSISKIFLLKEKWKVKINIDSFDGRGNNLISIISQISPIEEKAIEDYYEKSYGLKHKELYLVNVGIGFEGFLTTQCSSEWEIISRLVNEL